MIKSRQRKSQKFNREELQLIDDAAMLLAAYEIGITFSMASAGTKKRYRELAVDALRFIKMIP